jgi:hypothetical protein
MDRPVSEIDAAHSRPDRFLGPLGAAGLWLVALTGFLAVAIAGCADTGSANNPDNPKSGGFYGGVSGGWSHP